MVPTVLIPLHCNVVHMFLDDKLAELPLDIVVNLLLVLGLSLVQELEVFFVYLYVFLCVFFFRIKNNCIYIFKIYMFDIYICSAMVSEHEKYKQKSFHKGNIYKICVTVGLMDE